MDARQSRRTAETNARQLIAERTKLIGDLAVADTERATALQEIEAAREQGRELVREAEARAAELQQAAREHADTLEQRYSEQHAAAIAGGWSAADIKQLGFTAPATSPARRPRTTRSAAAKPADAEPATESTTDHHQDSTAIPATEPIAQPA